MSKRLLRGGVYDWPRGGLDILVEDGSLYGEKKMQKHLLIAVGDWIPSWKVFKSSVGASKIVVDD